jgi:hypothetical protein
MRALVALLCLTCPARAAVVVVVPLADDAIATSELRAALTSIPGFTVQPAAVTSESLAAAKALGLRCALSTPSCMAQLGGLANGDLVIGGARVPVTGGARVTLRLIEVASKKERRSATLVIPDGSGRARTLRLLATRLLAPERERGSLTVRVRPHGATILVDGVPHGVAPLSAPIVLMPGRHDVYIARPGHISATASVDVAFDEHASVDIELVRDDESTGLGVQPVERADGDASARAGRVAITDVEVTGGDSDIARPFIAALAVELEKLEDTSVIRLDDVPGLLEERTALMLACREIRCNQLIASSLAVDTLVQIDIHMDGDESRVAVLRVDGVSGSPLMAHSERAKRAGGAELLDAIGPTVEHLFANRSLRAGEARGAAVAAAAAAAAPIGLPPWVFFTSLAATGAAAGAAVGLFALSRFAGDDATKEAIELPLWVALGATAALTSADVAVAVFTDW